ncbi:hypothetical protein [Pradoshia sp.]
MKKYLSLTTIFVFLLTTFSIYYIQSAVAKNDKTQFIIEYVDGDKDLLKDIRVSGFYFLGNMGDSVTITDKETSYKSNLPFFEQMDYENLASSSKQYQKLKKKYPSFMRGKNNERYLFEDDNQVLYAEVDYVNSVNGKIKDFHFSINTLSKTDEQTNSYTIDVPKQKDIVYMEIYDVQYLYDEVRIVTANHKTNSSLTEVHQYTINLNKNQITDDKIIFTQNETSADYYSTMSLSEQNAIEPSNIVMFQTEEGHENDDGETTELKRKMYIYHYKEAKLSELALPAELQAQMDTDIAYLYNENYLYANKLIYDKETVKGAVYKIDLKTGKIANTANFTPSSDLQIIGITLNEDTIQLVGRDAEELPVFALYTLEDGKLLFEGKIDTKNQDSVNFNDLSLDMISGI